MFLPVRGPYDVQLLIEHVTESVRRRGLVQLLTGAARWMVRVQAGTLPTRCVGCNRRVGSVACTAPDGGPAHCLSCASDPAVPTPVPLRHAGAAR